MEVKDPQDRAKMEKKSMLKSIKNLVHLGIDFWKDLEGFWDPKWSRIRAQMGPRSRPKRTQNNAHLTMFP